jgi:hypothetical protein
VDQISAVENFVAFKKLMNKRNEELNTQALLAMTAVESKKIMDANKSKEDAKKAEAPPKDPSKETAKPTATPQGKTVP